MAIAIEQNIPLAPRTTIQAGGTATHFVSVHSQEELREAYCFAKREDLQVRILGGGSNVVVDDRGVKALVIHPLFTNITINEEKGCVTVTAGAGVVLDQLVEYVVEKKLWGLENLSGIPGSVGGVPIQNVGAYGVEAKDIIREVSVYDPLLDTYRVLQNTDCEFSYRNSIFKHTKGSHLVVTDVTFTLTKNPTPNIAYKDLALAFENTETPTLEEIRTAVLSIRAGKFPDWKIIGTAGSFFKNPFISKADYEQLTLIYPDLPGYFVNDSVKIPLGWILDKVLDLKGYRVGNVGLYEKQALVVVNYGRATSEEIISFGDSIIQKIFDATSIRVEREVVLLK